MKSQLFPKILSHNEIEQIINFYQNKDDAHTETGIINKNLEYHIPNNFSYTLLNPKLMQIFGEHEFDTGAYKESVSPYHMHVDSVKVHDSIPGLMRFANTKKHDSAVLIPLVEGPQFKTVVFDIPDIVNNLDRYKDQFISDNGLDTEDFSHDPNIHLMKQLPIHNIYQWKLGDIFIWGREQLHVSNNFARHGLIKKFLILFIA